MEGIVTRLEKMGDAIAPYAKARAERVYIENFLRSQKAILMQTAPEECVTIASKEAYAYSHPEYIKQLEGLKQAVEIEETDKWTLEHFKIQFEYWRTCQANDRFMRDRV